MNKEIELLKLQWRSSSQLTKLALSFGVTITTIMLVIVLLLIFALLTQLSKTALIAIGIFVCMTIVSRIALEFFLR